MKFGLMYSNVFGQPEAAVHLARTAEEVGLESLWTVEHVVVPVGYESPYPYSPTGRMPGSEDSPIPDPLIWLTYVAAATERIKLATGILILPQRHPFYVAKELATLDQLSKGRAILGVGIGWLREEFEGLGIPFEERAERTEESVRALRSLWKEGHEAFDGKFLRWAAVESNPKPVQAGGVPIVVGGHVNGSARRAARVGDGYFPLALGDEPRLGELIGVMGEECARIGRDPAEIEITTGFPVTDLDAVKRAQDLGVSRLMIPPPGFDPEGLRKGLEAFGDTVLAKL
jgi:probable F420-dependent oxidoreductase